MKKITIIGIVLLMFSVLFIAGCTENRIVDTNEQVVKIRVTAPLTGKFAYYGMEVQNALNIAFEDNKQMLAESNIIINLKYEDNTGDKVIAVNNFNMFLSEGNVPIIISTNTPLSQPLIPLAEQNSVNLLALVTGAKDFAKGNKYVFRDAIMSYDEGVLMARYLREIGFTEAASIVVNDDYGLSGAQGLKSEFENLGGTIVSEEVFENSATDVRAQISKIKEKNPQAIFLVGRETNIIAAVKQMNELGITSDKIYSVDSFESPTVLNGLGTSANGIIIISDYYDLSDSETKAFFERYNQKHGSDPGIYAIDAYSAGQYISQSLIECGVTSEEINTCLSSKKFMTIKGELSFNELHDATLVAGLFRISEGKKELIKKLD